jgi:6,7-dimethyl-8-ribityllumazine synthase
MPQHSSSNTLPTTHQPRYEGAVDGKPHRIGIAVARFNSHVTGALLDACVTQLKARGVPASHIESVSVPGALELPVALQRMAARQLEMKPRYSALIALGAIIRGETYHFEVVSNESASGLMELSLDTGIPIANGVLTTNTEAQAMDRVAVKGAECADVALELANLFVELK